MFLCRFPVGYAALRPRLKAVAPMGLYWLLYSFFFEPLRDVEAGAGFGGVFVVAVDGGDGVLFH